MGRYTEDDIKRIALMASEIREKARNRDKACFAEAQEFAHMHLRSINAKAASDLENGALIASRNNDFAKFINDLQEYCGRCFRIMIEDIQAQERQTQTNPQSAPNSAPKAGPIKPNPTAPKFSEIKPRKQ